MTLSIAPSNKKFLIITAVGILLYGLSSWPLFRSSGSEFIPDAYVVSRLFQLLVIVIIAVLSLKGRLTMVNAGRFAPVAGILMAICGIAVFMNNASVQRSDILMVATSVHGVASALLFIGWGAYSGHMHPRASAPAIATGLLAYNICAMALPEVPTILVFILAVVAPMICGLLLKYCVDGLEREIGEPATEGAEKGKSKLSRALKDVPWSMFALLYACCIVVVVTNISLPSFAEARLYASNIFLAGIYLMVLVLFAVWFMGFKRDTPYKLWPFFAVIVIVGLFAYSSFSVMNLRISVYFLFATQDCLVVFLWAMLACVIYKRNVPHLAWFAIGMLPQTLSSPLPRVLTTVLFPDMEPLNSQSGIILCFAMATLICVFTVLQILRTTMRDKPEGGVMVMGDGEVGLSFADKIEKVAQNYGLSKREEEVMAQLARGYTLKQIADNLVVSENTIRSHAKSIYRKMDINSKMELIEVVEKTEADTDV